MSASQSHENCLHPSTKSARAKCRAARKASAISRAESIEAVRAAYFEGEGVEELMAALHKIDPELTEGYYHGDDDVEEIIFSAK